MATMRLIPSSYSVSSTTYLTVSNPSNMYNNTDNTSYATITNTRTSTTSYYLYIKGFNFDAIPEDATINSFTIKFKAYETGLSTSTSYRPYLVNNTTTLTGSCNVLSTSTQTLSFTGVSDDWDTIKGYGNNFGIRITCRRSSRNTTGYAYVYGAEILVDYTLPVNYTLTTSITNGALVKPESASFQVSEGASQEFIFKGNDEYELQSMTINGSAVTPTQKIFSATAPTVTVSTNYDTYAGSIDNLLDNDNSTYFWSNGGQAVGKYILFTFSTEVTLNSFSTYSSNSSDYVRSHNVLQVSDDGNNWTDVGNFTDSQTSTFSNINAQNIKYVRIYVKTSGQENWLYLNNVTMDYDYSSMSGEYWTYTLSNIAQDTDVVILFEMPSAHFIKIDGAWERVLKCYKKINGQWTEFEYTYDENTKLVYKGSTESDES